jgi:hypothetical protein
MVTARAARRRGSTLFDIVNTMISAGSYRTVTREYPRKRPMKLALLFQGTIEIVEKIGFVPTIFFM